MKCIALLAVMVVTMYMSGCNAEMRDLDDFDFDNEEINENADVEDPIRAEGWFKRTLHKAKNVVKKAAKGIKKGCSYVNKVPFKQLVFEATIDLHDEGADDIDEQQVVAAYGALKKGCKAVGHLKK